MGVPELGTFQEPSYTKMSANEAKINEMISIAQDALDSTRGLYDLLEELKQLDSRWYFNRFTLKNTHTNPLSVLDELIDTLKEEIDSREE